MCEGWDTKVKSGLGTTLGKFYVRLMSLAVFQQCQQQQQHTQVVVILWRSFIISMVVVGGIIIPPSPCSLSADLNRLGQRRKWMSSSHAMSGGGGGGDDVNCGASTPNVFLMQMMLTWIHFERTWWLQNTFGRLKASGIRGLCGLCCGAAIHCVYKFYNTPGVPCPNTAKNTKLKWIHFMLQESRQHMWDAKNYMSRESIRNWRNYNILKLPLEMNCKPDLAQSHEKDKPYIPLQALITAVSETFV